MTIDLLEYFQAEAKRHTESLAAAQAVAVQAKARLPALEGEVASVQTTLRDKRDFVARAAQEGLDTGKLDGAIADLQAQLDVAAAKLSSCRAEIDAARRGPHKPFERELALVHSVADRLNSTSAIEVRELRDCYAHLAVKVSEENAAGQPTEVEVGLGRMKPIHVPVTHARARVSANFKPKSLAWVPLVSFPHGTTEDEVVAFLDTSRRVVILPTIQFDEFDYGRSGLVNVDLVVSLEEHLRARLGDVEEIDLERAYVDDELVELLRIKTLAATSTSGPFRPSTERLTTRDIANRLHDDWAAFVGCPWAANVTGALALLKYLGENGERPRFWCEDHQGHYGFRLRTRDHTWLVGEAFLVPDEPAPDGAAPMSVVPSTGGSAAIASLGRMHLKVTETR